MRRKTKIKVERRPDPLYTSELVGRFTNYVMQDGKKTKAQKVVYGALELVKKNTKGQNPLKVLDEAIKHSSPLLEVRSRRVGGATYQVPREVRPNRRIALAMKWIIGAARGKKGKPMAEKLSEEILQASRGEGAAVKKRDDTHKMAEANRAFAHFSW
jgi:small subunit ribosomal protein S7